jgi:hypothetical protein
MTAQQMGLFDGTAIADTGADTAPQAAITPEAEAREKDAAQNQDQGQRGQDRASPATTRPELPTERRVFTAEIWGYDPRVQRAYHYINEVPYYAISTDAAGGELLEDALPEAPCRCGGRRFIAGRETLRGWRCIRCAPPCPTEHVVVYEVPKEEEDDSDDEQADQ